MSCRPNKCIPGLGLSNEKPLQSALQTSIVIDPPSIGTVPSLTNWKTDRGPDEGGKQRSDHVIILGAFCRLHRQIIDVFCIWTTHSFLFSREEKNFKTRQLQKKIYGRHERMPNLLPKSSGLPPRGFCRTFLQFDVGILCDGIPTILGVATTRMAVHNAGYHYGS